MTQPWAKEEGIEVISCQVLFHLGHTRLTAGSRNSQRLDVHESHKIIWVYSGLLWHLLLFRLASSTADNCPWPIPCDSLESTNPGVPCSTPQGWTCDPGCSMLHFLGHQWSIRRKTRGPGMANQGFLEGLMWVQKVGPSFWDCWLSVACEPIAAWEPCFYHPEQN